MHSVRLLSILSVSSEDPSYPASNLLTSDSFRKWSCRCDGSGKPLCGEQCSVIIKLDRPSEIWSIDLGNNGSAFVEILAGRACEPDQFHVILPSSMLMSPSESRDNFNPNRVRMFSGGDLSMTDQKFDQIKIVCTQLMAKNSMESEVKQRETVPMKPGSFFTIQKAIIDDDNDDDDEPADKVRKVADYDEILDGVKFALSGYENPYRAEIRDKAVEMGAQYFPKWNRSCTHLICAFPNTPKFEEAKRDGGLIVSEKWIVDCARVKTKLDISKYLVRKSAKSAIPADGVDDDSENNGLDKLKKLPDILKDERIFIAKDVSDVDRHECTRLIVAFGGFVADSLDDKNITTIVTDADRWDKSDSDEIPAGAVCVGIDWLQECHDSELIPDKTKYSRA